MSETKDLCISKIFMIVSCVFWSLLLVLCKFHSLSTFDLIPATWSGRLDQVWIIDVFARRLQSHLDQMLPFQTFPDCLFLVFSWTEFVQLKVVSYKSVSYCDISTQHDDDILTNSLVIYLLGKKIFVLRNHFSYSNFSLYCVTSQNQTGFILSSVISSSENFICFNLYILHPPIFMQYVHILLSLHLF